MGLNSLLTQEQILISDQLMILYWSQSVELKADVAFFTFRAWYVLYTYILIKIAHNG